MCWTVQAALACPGLTSTYLSTDDFEIEAAGRSCGPVGLLQRSPELASDSATHDDVLIDALEQLEICGETCDYLVLMQPTSPLRTSVDITEAIGVARDRRCEAVVSVAEAATHPFLVHEIGEDGRLKYLLSPPSDLRRQTLPRVYAPNGAIYVLEVQAVREGRALRSPDTIPYVMPEERSLDIDTEWDLHVADLILRNDERRADNTNR